MQIDLPYYWSRLCRTISDRLEKHFVMSRSSSARILLADAAKHVSKRPHALPTSLLAVLKRLTHHRSLMGCEMTAGTPVQYSHKQFAATLGLKLAGSVTP